MSTSGEQSGSDDADSPTQPLPRPALSSLNLDSSRDFSRAVTGLHSQLQATVEAEREQHFLQTGEKHPDDVRREEASWDIFFGCPPISEIVPGALYLGDERFEAEHLRKWKIRTIVNCAAADKSDRLLVDRLNEGVNAETPKKRGLFSRLLKRPPPQSSSAPIQLFEFSISDVESYPISEFLDEIVQIILKPSNHPVFVRCAMGVSRSATAVFAYLMRKNRWNLDQAYLETMRRRKIVYPNMGFIKQLLDYEKKLFGEEEEVEREDES